MAPFAIGKIVGSTVVALSFQHDGASLVLSHRSILAELRWPSDPDPERLSIVVREMLLFTCFCSLEYAATRMDLLEGRENRLRPTAPFCRRFAHTGNLQQTVALPSHGGGSLVRNQHRPLLNRLQERQELSACTKSPRHVSSYRATTRISARRGYYASWRGWPSPARVLTPARELVGS